MKRKNRRRVAGLFAMVMAMMLSMTALAGPGDTYIWSLTEKGEDLYERGPEGFYVDHYHGDTVSVTMYEFLHNDVSLAGNTGYYRFYCSEGKFLYFDGETSSTAESMAYKYNNIDGTEVDSIDGNAIKVREFSIKPGRYVFGSTQDGDGGSYSDGVYVTLNQDLSIAEGFFASESNDTPLTLEAGDKVRVYVFHQGYIDGNFTNGFGEKDIAFREKYLPLFQEWAAKNEEKAQARDDAAQQEPSEVIEVDPTTEPASGDTQEQESTTTPEPQVTESPKATITPAQPVEEEQGGSNVAALVIGGVVLLLLIGLGVFFITKKK